MRARTRKGPPRGEDLGFGLGEFVPGAPAQTPAQEKAENWPDAVGTVCGFEVFQECNKKAFSSTGHWAREESDEEGPRLPPRKKLVLFRDKYLFSFVIFLLFFFFGGGGRVNLAHLREWFTCTFYQH